MTNVQFICLLGITVKKLYTGQARGHFRSRWKSYKSKSRSFDRGEECMQEYLQKHFENETHSSFFDNVSVILIDKTDGLNPTKRETYWMRTMKIIIPYGLNVENGY